MKSIRIFVASTLLLGTGVCYAIAQVPQSDQKYHSIKSKKFETLSSSEKTYFKNALTNSLGTTLDFKELISIQNQQRAALKSKGPKTAKIDSVMAIKIRTRDVQIEIMKASGIKNPELFVANQEKILELTFSITEKYPELKRFDKVAKAEIFKLASALP